MPKTVDLTGRRFGKLTVMDKLDEREERYFVYRCLCDCGNEIKVNTKRLLHGTVQGCPKCWKKRERIVLDLTGQRFGRLVAVKSAEERLGGRKMWECRCDCGNVCLVSTSDLRSGHTASCGCVRGVNRKYKDLSGMTFGWLTAISRTGERDYKGSLMWKCRCKCGAECRLSEDKLVHGNNVSCGCYKKTVLSQQLGETLHYVDGTCVEFLQRKKRRDNTSGCTGVHKLKNGGKYRADISFKKRRYHLGTFDTLEEAVEARRRALEMHEEFLDAWYREHPDAKQGHHADRNEAAMATQKKTDGTAGVKCVGALGAPEDAH